MTTIDLNADLGEGGACDLELLDIVSSCNVACGGHAGDDESMQATICAAKAAGVAIGAHPSYPDRDGFGRRSRFLEGDALADAMLGQVSRFKAHVKSEAGILSHVKPHGALYNDAAIDSTLAEMIVSVVQRAAPDAAIVGPPDSALQKAARNAPVLFIGEAFVDRMYLPNGRLVPRVEPGAVHSDINTMTAQAVSLATSGTTTAQDGSVIKVAAKTLCIHGDSSGAAAVARAVRDVLQANGVDVHAAI
ncbi:MAG: 5-oxoprolinase subunit PxpA [Woeseiaceae bacterium]